MALILLNKAPGTFSTRVQGAADAVPHTSQSHASSSSHRPHGTGRGWEWSKPVQRLCVARALATVKALLPGSFGWEPGGIGFDSTSGGGRGGKQGSMHALCV